MNKESKIILVVYLIAIVIITFNSFKYGYETLSPFIFEGTGHKIGWVLAAKRITLSWLVSLIALSRLIHIIINKGIDKSVPSSIYGKALRYLALSFLVICIFYKFTAYTIAFGTPYGGLALMFNHLFPSFSLSIILFEASRIYAYEENRNYSVGK